MIDNNTMVSASLLPTTTNPAEIQHAHASETEEQLSIRSVGTVVYPFKSPFALYNYYLSVCLAVLRCTGLEVPQVVPIFQWPRNHSIVHGGWRFQLFSFALVGCAIILNAIVTYMMFHGPTSGSSWSSDSSSYRKGYLFFVIVWTVIALYTVVAVIYNYTQLRSTFCFDLIVNVGGSDYVYDDLNNELFEVTHNRTRVDALLTETERSRLFGLFGSRTQARFTINVHNGAWLSTNFYRPMAFLFGNAVVSFAALLGVLKSLGAGEYNA